MNDIQILWIIIKLLLLLIYPSSFVSSETTYCYTTITGIYKSCESGNWTVFRDKDSAIKEYPNKIEITNKKVNIFENNALKNVSSSSLIKYLQLNLADIKLHIEPLAFSNLAALENLEINSASVLLDTDIFYGLNNLKYLKIKLANETKSYLNDLLDKHLNLHKLEFVNHQDVDICDFTRQNTSLNIFELQYTGGSMTVVTRQSFYCLKNLQNLTITESNLTLIFAGAFNVLKKLKKVSFISNNKLTHIPSSVFNTVRSLEIIDLSNNSINEIDKGAFEIVSNKLSLLNLSYNSLEIVEEGIFKNIKCKVIDLTQSQIVAIVDGAFNSSHVHKIFLFNNDLFTVNNLKWGFNNNTIVYYQYINYDIAIDIYNKSINLIDFNDSICYPSNLYYFQICKTTSMKLKLVKNLIDNWQPSTLEITDYNISSIEENAFQNLSIKILIINSFATILSLYPSSFTGLKKLKYLKLNTLPIEIKSHIFDCLTSLRSLEITVDESSTIPPCHLFKNVKLLEALLLSHEDKVNICDKNLCTNDHFHLTNLHYQYGKFTNLQKLAFSCLKQLDYLAVTNSKLVTIEPDAFNGLDSIKYLILSSNQIQTIDNNVFTNLNLSLLDLSYNLITHIKKETFYGIKTKTLDISYNKIIEIDNGAFKDINLDHLYYHNNVGVFDNTQFWYIDDSQIEGNCVIDKLYKICIKNKSLSFVSLKNPGKNSFSNYLQLPSDKLEFTGDKISSINEYAFKGSNIQLFLKTLIIHKTIKSEFIIYTKSFDGLTKLENLILDVGPIALKENLFDRLTSLNYLEIEIKYNPQSPLKYINNVLKTVPSIRVLEILNSDSINICNNPRSNKNLLPITGLYYTGGSIITLPTNSLICLWNLEKLSISKTQLTTIEAGVFDSMTVLKYIYLAFNKITRISTGIFDSLNDLITLDLNHNKINGIDDKSLRKYSVNNLHLLNLSYNEFSIIEKNTFEGFKCSQLDLSHNKIGHIEDNAFKDTDIHDIFLLNNAISDIKIKAWKIPLFTFVHVKKPSYFISFCSGKRTRVCDNSGSCEFKCIDYNSNPPGLG